METLFDGQVCTKCGAWKTFAEYGKEYGRCPGLLQRQCKSCRYKQSNHAAEVRRWKLKNPEKARASAQRVRQRRLVKAQVELARYRAKLKQNGGTFTAQEWADLCASYGNRCLCCGKTGRMTIDHVVPTSKGGRNDIPNLQPLCRPCNSRKGDKTIDYRLKS